MRLVFCLPIRGSTAQYKPEYFYGKGLGGGECALYVLTHQLAKMGHQVELYSPINTGKEQDGIYYGHSAELNPQEYCDAFILFRSPNHLLREQINTPVRLFWSIDQFTEGDYERDVFPFVDYTVTISPYHTRYHIGRYKADAEKIHHIDLPVKTDDYKLDIEKIPGRLLYSSVEIRGLWYLPRFFQRIKEAIPEASLVITADYTLWGAKYTGLERAPGAFGHLRDVQILGAIPRKDLIRQQLEADILAYPCIYEELFCLSVAEAQIAGAVPVTTDIGAIKTTLDTGFLIPLRPGMPQYEEAFVGHIVRLLSARAELERLQKEARAKATERFSPKRIANEWIALIKKLQKGETIRMTKPQCEYKKDGKQCSRLVNAPDRYCWQHKRVPAERLKGLAPTDLENRIMKRGRIIHLGCRGHHNTLEIQVGTMPSVECFAGDDPGAVDKDTTIVLLDVIPHWGLERTRELTDAWTNQGAEIVAFLPLGLQRYQEFGQVRTWTKEELEELGFEVELLEQFHRLPEGCVDACWAVK